MGNGVTRGQETGEQRNRVTTKPNNLLNMVPRSVGEYGNRERGKREEGEEAHRKRVTIKERNKKYLKCYPDKFRKWGNRETAEQGNGDQGNRVT